MIQSIGQPAQRKHSWDVREEMATMDIVVREEITLILEV